MNNKWIESASFDPEYPEDTPDGQPYEPSAMSELGFASWLSDRFNYGCIGLLPAPKKLTWIQKIRDYDYQKNMADYYRSMYDTWRSIGHEKLHELKLMEKVADNWQQKLIDQNAIIGKSLKFSVGHNHIKIIVGNPATYCENYESNNKRIGCSVSLCSHKDVYNWKTGVIQSLDNLCNEKKYSHTLRRDLRKALAKKYPEVFNDRTSAGN